MHILLLRDPSCPLRSDFSGERQLTESSRSCPQEDPYAKEFKNYHYRTSSIPVLTHHCLNLAPLRTILKSDPTHTYWGIVVTSAKTVQALEQAIPPQSNESPSALWSNLPVFVVGESTKRACQRFFPTEQPILGADSGNAEQLANFIHDYYQIHHISAEDRGAGFHRTLGSSSSSGDQAQHDNLSSPGPTRPSLLYLVSQIRRPTLIHGLLPRGISVTELAVYNTVPNPEFNTLIEQYLKPDVRLCGENTLPAATPSTRLPFQWVVFFSPSGVDAALPTLRAWNCTPPNVHYAAIGLTTAQHLVQSYGLTPALVASQPTPQCLAKEVHHHVYGSANGHPIPPMG
ncbi:uroporphyrinogen-III synthase [Dispira parvispora]|uniref:Uroporphyrinogen-III synthase n=1 Tax=Dispira parvispora TaxID=1520584 RepID=A0A9W8ATZ5_9FUNG|nr:uroporphyrinogen-III synthase [Dispira parvispora]